VADAFGPNTLSERLIVFEHPSEALCSMYVRKINMYMEGRSLYILKLFQAAHIALYRLKFFLTQKINCVFLMYQDELPKCYQE
jgi:hypothetical protein